MKEVWKAVVGAEGRYEVSNLGCVRSLDQIISYTKKGRMLRPGRSSTGYASLVLGGGRSCSVHTLVAEAFLGPQPAGHHVRHLDGKRMNNRADNLAYGTPVENRADADRHQTSVRGSKYRTAKLDEKAARAIRRLRGKVSQAELARRYRVSPAAIQAVHDGRTWTHA